VERAAVCQRTKYKYMGCWLREPGKLPIYLINIKTKRESLHFYKNILYLFSDDKKPAYKSRQTGIIKGTVSLSRRFLCYSVCWFLYPFSQGDLYGFYHIRDDTDFGFVAILRFAVDLAFVYILCFGDAVAGEFIYRHAQRPCNPVHSRQAQFGFAVLNVAHVCVGQLSQFRKLFLTDALPQPFSPDTGTDVLVVQPDKI